MSTTAMQHQPKPSDPYNKQGEHVCWPCCRLDKEFLRLQLVALTPRTNHPENPLNFSHFSNPPKCFDNFLGQRGGFGGAPVTEVISMVTLEFNVRFEADRQITGLNSPCEGNSTKGVCSPIFCNLGFLVMNPLEPRKFLLREPCQKELLKLRIPLRASSKFRAHLSYSFPLHFLHLLLNFSSKRGNAAHAERSGF